MATKIGAGYSNITNSHSAGIAAANAAIENGNITQSSFALLFCSGKHNAEEFSAGVHGVLGNIPMAGGTAMGVFTSDHFSYEGFEVMVTVIESDTLTFKVLNQPDIDLNEYDAGVALGKQIKEVATEKDNNLLLFYDSAKSQNPPMLNFGTLLIAGIEQNLPSEMITAGGGFLGDMLLSPCYQFVNDQVLTQNAIAILIGNCTMVTTIMHGCRPSSSYLTITKTNGPVILEIDNRPALDVIDELVGGSGLKWKDFAYFITFGINRGDKFGTFNEELYANRLTLAVDEANKALIMFEPDLKAGDEVQLMRRSFDLDYVYKNVENIIQKLNDKKPLFAFYINCGGRAKPYAGGTFEDVEEIQKAFVGKMPFMGFYSGVEIAKVGNTLQPLDWTGVLCMFSE